MEDLGKRAALIIGLALVASILEAGGFCEAAAMPDPSPGGDMRSALKFLQDMDSYYGQIARPRAKRSIEDGNYPSNSNNQLYPDNWLHYKRSSDGGNCIGEDCAQPRFMWLQNTDESIARFGKRNSEEDEEDPNRFMTLQNVENAVARFSRPRFGKRSSGFEHIPLVARSDSRIAKLKDVDDAMSRFSRPRFGKRSSEVPTAKPRFATLQGADDAIARLSRPRFGKRSGPLVMIPKEEYLVPEAVVHSPSGRFKLVMS